ncbi:ABC transporter ATP-binding protein [Mahella australiensis]|uniref:ABC transporter related protein n=1 Tax=Mahella australiensis (strain DSM 15567 / CIP 107919 / 50-1 BON) TaxID=697281 RepID=F3ZXT7_MAHA5|nr:ABC transporter ATP-binding protein [Mahella australiensis]AEE96607.1 ABC transporter related protein [Mahella australiensis 50-1 BON]
MSQIMVHVDKIGLTYQTAEGETEAIRDISMDIYEKDFVGIVGPSGCGKSTLLSIIAGLIKPTRGTVIVDGQPVDGPSNKIGYMLQEDYLFEWRSIWQNVLLGLEIQNKVNESTKSHVEQLLKNYGLYEFRYHYPHQLSGGMRQRAALIRTLALNPEILLLDEPFSALDYQTRLAVSEEVAAIIKQEGKTAVLVTHDISEAISMSDRIYVLSQRPAIVKNVYDIRLSCQDKTPLNARKCPEFREYFNSIWKELDIHVG